MQALSTSPVGSSANHHKVTRLRRACDMCSQRKVKCDESGPPCKPCADLEVECTFHRAMKRRGPPNKHAEAAKAAKRAREGEGQSQTITPSPVTQHAPPVLSPVLLQDGTNEILDGELIAPWPVIELLIDDFFTYIHPLVPFPHEPTFRRAFADRMDRVNREFLALLSSMIGLLVASFPRSARAHLKSTHSTNLFPTSLTMIERCRHVALVARGSSFMAKTEMSVDDAATSYFLGVAAAYALQIRLCKRFMAETMTFCRETMMHRSNDGLDLDSPSASKPIDHIQDQMSKRLFWVIVAGVRSMTQLGQSINELPLPPPTAQEPYPDQPLEVDDEYIYASHILPQPEGVLPLVAGFNRNIRVYTTMNELVGVDMCYGINFFDWSAQKNILFNGLAAAKGSTEDLPLELQVRIEEGQIQDPLGFDRSDLQYYPPSFPLAQPANDVRHAFSQHPMRRRQLQFEIQKANIYASQLATRSYFVERYLNLRDAHRSQLNFAETEQSDDEKDDRDSQVAQERELIVQNLLTVLASINQRNIEPNGGSLVNKIRQVASTLLNDAPERKGAMAVKVEDYLGRFLEILMKLEKTGAPSSSGSMTPQDEEQELQHWANLRDIQLQFAESGGY
ncbi:uncharacterized protein B0I36DRAFT_244855 [Microdochium trichocladiopsis]|uniref:Zn(2)-C6 fungal-type domain-containing protein n=1 Tax=Microdochium trichocladiopsis TaxID=1682393 RepID=A0A9P8Y472_9PEZI|nr:uncharacterized protein B0I36DRAFT_244855 [Microdochium trichocladiopsis]KAH7029045.1 hypothetical protein B0I36DRAFT_244855 [Microdochium trichocladiopsis]